MYIDTRFWYTGAFFWYQWTVFCYYTVNQRKLFLGIKFSFHLRTRLHEYFSQHFTCKKKKKWRYHLTLCDRTCTLIIEIVFQELTPAGVPVANSFPWVTVVVLTGNCNIIAIYNDVLLAETFEPCRLYLIKHVRSPIIKILMCFYKIVQRGKYPQ